MDNVRNKLIKRVNCIVDSCLSEFEKTGLRNLSGMQWIENDEIIQCLIEDVFAYIDNDPASTDPGVLIEYSSSFEAVVHYRIASYIYLLGDTGSLTDSIAKRISDIGKRKSGVDINPAANIGSRFVLDHANGTVIGETCEIGNDCYLLGGVILGAYGIANNPSVKRHPTIGNGVQIGSSAKILGPVCVGDGAFIGPNCVVTNDVEAGGKITIVNQVQIERDSGHYEDTLNVSGVLVDPVTGRITLLGRGLGGLSAEIVDHDYMVVEGCICHIDVASEQFVEIQLSAVGVGAGNLDDSQYHLQLRNKGRIVTVLRPVGLREVLGVLAPNQTETDCAAKRLCY